MPSNVHQHIASEATHQDNLEAISIKLNPCNGGNRTLAVEAAFRLEQRIRLRYHPQAQCPRDQFSASDERLVQVPRTGSPCFVPADFCTTGTVYQQLLPSDLSSEARPAFAVGKSLAPKARKFGAAGKNLGAPANFGSASATYWREQKGPEALDQFICIDLSFLISIKYAQTCLKLS